MSWDCPHPNHTALVPRSTSCIRQLFARSRKRNKKLKSQLDASYQTEIFFVFMIRRFSDVRQLDQSATACQPKILWKLHVVEVSRTTHVQGPLWLVGQEELRNQTHTNTQTPMFFLWCANVFPSCTLTATKYMSPAKYTHIECTTYLYYMHAWI